MLNLLLDPQASSGLNQWWERWANKGTVSWDFLLSLKKKRDCLLKCLAYSLKLFLTLSQTVFQLIFFSFQNGLLSTVHFCLITIIPFPLISANVSLLLFRLILVCLILVHLILVRLILVRLILVCLILVRLILVRLALVSKLTLFIVPRSPEKQPKTILQINSYSRTYIRILSCILTQCCDILYSANFFDNRANWSVKKKCWFWFVYSSTINIFVVVHSLSKEGLQRQILCQQNSALWSARSGTPRCDSQFMIFFNFNQ